MGLQASVILVGFGLREIHCPFRLGGLSGLRGCSNLLRIGKTWILHDYRPSSGEGWGGTPYLEVQRVLSYPL